MFVIVWIQQIGQKAKYVECKRGISSEKGGSKNIDVAKQRKKRTCHVWINLICMQLKSKTVLHSIHFESTGMSVYESESYFSLLPQEIRSWTRNLFIKFKRFVVCVNMFERTFNIRFGIFTNVYLSQES